MRFNVTRITNPKHSHRISKDKTLKNYTSKSSRIKSAVTSMACVLILTASSSLFADAHFGVGLSDGEKNLTWVENNVSVTDEMATKLNAQWNAREDEFFTDVDYEEYVKSFKLYMVFKRNF